MPNSFTSDAGAIGWGAVPKLARHPSTSDSTADVYCLSASSDSSVCFHCLWQMPLGPLERADNIQVESTSGSRQQEIAALPWIARRVVNSGNLVHMAEQPMMNHAGENQQELRGNSGRRFDIFHLPYQGNQHSLWQQTKEVHNLLLPGRWAKRPTVFRGERFRLCSCSSCWLWQ